MLKLTIKKGLSMSLALLAGILFNSCGKNNNSGPPPLGLVTAPSTPLIPPSVSPPSAEFISNCTKQSGSPVVSGGQNLCQTDYFPGMNINYSGSGSVFVLFGSASSGLPVLQSGGSSPNLQGIFTGIFVEPEDKLSYSCRANWTLEIEDAPDLSGNEATLLATSGNEILPMTPFGVSTGAPSGSSPGSGALYFREKGFVRIGFNAPATVPHNDFTFNWSIRCQNLVLSRCKNQSGNNYPCP